LFIALCRGAWGYALKSDFDRLEDAIVEVHEGGGYFSPKIAAKVARFFQNPDFQREPEYVKLTPREKEVLQHLVHGEKKKYQDVADAMFISYAAVHSHMKNIYKKLHVTSKSEAIMKAIEGRLV
ncbi:MAG: response regulator transcription factor, partial [Bacteroidota bacterium]